MGIDPLTLMMWQTRESLINRQYTVLPSRLDEIFLEDLSRCILLGVDKAPLSAEKREPH